MVGVSTSVTDGPGTIDFLPCLRNIPGDCDPPGFVTASVADAVVTLGKQPNYLVMKLGGLSETVSVTAGSPIIDVKANAVTASVDSELIELIPKNRGLLSASHAP